MVCTGTTAPQPPPKQLQCEYLCLPFHWRIQSEGATTRARRAFVASALGTCHPGRLCVARYEGAIGATRAVVDAACRRLVLRGHRLEVAAAPVGNQWRCRTLRGDVCCWRLLGDWRLGRPALGRHQHSEASAPGAPDAGGCRSLPGPVTDLADPRNRRHSGPHPGLAPG